MASTTTASARLRKTFAYPDSSDSDSEDLDEEHQEKLIASLQAEDTRKNEFYRKMFTAIPIVAGMFFLWVLMASGTARERWSAVLGVSSFGMTGWGLWNSEGKKGGGRFGGDMSGPLERYLPVLNGVLVGVLGIAAGLSWRQGKVEEAWRSLLPGVIFGIAWVVKGLLEPVDVGELEGRRFGLKGA